MATAESGAPAETDTTGADSTGAGATAAPNDATEPGGPSLVLLGAARDAVAIANSGGGTLVVSGLAQPLDDDTLMRQIGDILSGQTVEIVRHTVDIDNDRVEFRIAPHPAPPLVITANVSAQKGRSSVQLTKGDVLVRHSGKTRRATRADHHGWIDAAVKAEGDRWTSRLSLLAEIPPGSKVRVLPTTGEAFDEPTVMLERALSLWRSNPARLLSGNDLIVAFLARATIDRSDEASELLIASALRRRPTLWFWLAERPVKVDRFHAIFDALLSGGDRDKTDAGRSLVEVAALLLNSEDFNVRVAELRKSRYRHFQEAADGIDRVTVLDRLTKARSATVRRRAVQSFGTTELVELGDQLAAELRVKPSSSRSRQLSVVGLELYARDLESAARQFAGDADPRPEATTERLL